MTIITFLGLIGGRYTKEEKVELWPKYKGADYTIHPALSEALGVERECPCCFDNMLPLLVELFPDAVIIGVGTEASIAVQYELMKQRGMADCFPSGNNLVKLESEHDFEAIFAVLSSLLKRYGDVIVDISHSFRHLPILMTVDMLIENIIDPSKIRHILFAKEIKKDIEYEIIDLGRYLDLAAITYALASFNDNYTVARSIKVKDANYKALLDMLADAGEHIMANSFEALFEGKDEVRPLVQRIRSALEAIRAHPVSLPLLRYLERIDDHIAELEELIGERPDRRYHAFSKLMYDKGYLLNAVTLLDEALARYCLEGIRKIDSGFADAISDFESRIDELKGEHNKVYNRYALSSQAKNAIKHHKKNRKMFLEDEALNSRLLNHIGANRSAKLRKLIFSCDNLRNDLAHGNTLKYYENIRKDVGRLFKRYFEVCVKADPLGCSDEPDLHD
jgi:CRISPR-associated DxTHG motif protein